MENRQKETSYVKSQSNFKKWFQKVDNDKDNNCYSEADTRSKYIDSLFTEVLNWDESQIKREGYVNKVGFYDYIFNSGKNRFVLEAKKADIDFYMPKVRTIKCNSLNDKNCSLKAAIVQGVDYAAVNSIDVVVVFNGKQMAVTYIPYMIHSNHHDTYLFWNLEDLRNNFTRLFNILSPLVKSEVELPPLIITDKSNTLIRNRPSFLGKITNKQPDNNIKQKTNELAQYFEYIHGRYFSNITSDNELLKKCYCDNETAGKLEREIEVVLRDRSPLLDYPIEEIETTKRTAGKFEKRFLKSENNTKLFLLLGGSGVGKTTFIFRYFNFILSKEDREYIVWLYLDFAKLSEEGQNIDDFVFDEIEEQLLEKYEELDLYSNSEKIKAIFSKDLKKEQGTINLLPTEDEKQRAVAQVINESKKNKGHHIKRIFEYLRSMGYATSIVYDNVDQLNFDLQTRLFKHSNALRESLNTMVITSLREEVYYEHREDRSFNYAEIELFHIQSPRLLNVLSKRIKLLKDETDEDEQFSVENEAGALITVKKRDIIDVLSETFLGESENILLIEMLANNDMRDSLKYFKSIISSHNINFDELLISAGMHAVDKSASKVIKSDQILRGLALQDRIHFNSNKSDPIINIFSVESDGFFSHFTQIRILLYALSRMNQTLGKLPQGYYKLKEMYNESFKMTVNNLESFQIICSKLQQIGALVNSNGRINKIHSNDYVKLGPAGKYYLDYLLYNPFYLSLMSIDTTIANQEYQERISKIYESSLHENYNMRRRRYIAMSNHFINYLIEEEAKEREYLVLNQQDFDNDYFGIADKIKEDHKKYLARNNLN